MDVRSNNHEGSSGKMEVSSITEMFLRSEVKYGVKYGNYIGDGDPKAFKAILDGDNPTRCWSVHWIQPTFGTASRRLAISTPFLTFCKQQKMF